MEFYGYFMRLCLLHWTWFWLASAGTPSPKHRGRYTRDASEYEILVPHKVDADGAFQSFELPHFYNLEEARSRRAAPGEEPAHVRYSVPLGGREHVVELWPNHGFLSPGLVVERRHRDLWRDPQLNHVRREQCHYVGHVRGIPASRAALSACHDGLAGYVRTGDAYYFVEPAEEARPDGAGRHLHVAFLGRSLRDANDPRGDFYSFCGVSNNWQDAWRDRFSWELQMNPEFPSMLSRARSSALVPRFLEILLVLDKKFIEFHRDHNSEIYALTLMNMVSDYYHDATVGRNLEVVVVRIMFLEREEEELDLTVSRNAEETYESFKTWAQRVNPADPKHPNHHDIAVMVTRYDICADNMTNCNLLGLAAVAAACQPHHSACVTEDTGLVTGVTIAHEIGHVMGSGHDDGENDDGVSCVGKAPDGSGYVMAPYLMSRTSVWSNCSGRLISALVDSGMGECLLDEPEGQMYKGPVMPPGAMYDSNYQCKDLIGSTEVCPSKQDEMCKMLWCKTSPDTCSTPAKPAADGTKCGEGKWCYNGECVLTGQRPSSVDGNWGAWSSWSPCSRTCGAGVETTERICDNPPPQNKGRYCLGDRKRYRVCNVQPCDPSKPTFREVQCSAFDDKPFDGKLFKWKPYAPPKNSECELLCYNEVPFYSSLAPLVHDGTPCRKGTHDMCVGGQCRRVGCDWVLDSDAVEDTCGECDGDGSHCRVVETLFDTPNGNRYVKIKTVPTNSYNVKIEETEPTVNTIAVSSEDGDKFYLNGNYTEYGNGEYSFGSNVRGLYSHPEPERELLAIKGPTSEDLAVYVVFYGHSNPGVRISYYERSESSYVPSYHWEFLEWEPCSVRCGAGSHISEASCVEKKAGKVSASFCNATVKPRPINRVCNQHKCRARWHVGSWGQCSGCIDHPGVQHRTVECMSENPVMDGDPVPEELSKCNGQKPHDSQPCTSNEPCKSKVLAGENMEIPSLTKEDQTVISTLHHHNSVEITTRFTTPMLSIPNTSSARSHTRGMYSTQVTSSIFKHTTTHSYATTTQMKMVNDRSRKGQRQLTISTQPGPLRRAVTNTSITDNSTLKTSTNTSLLFTPHFTSSTSTSVSTSHNYIKPTPEIAIDRVPENQLILKEAPLVGASYNKTLSETAEQEMGENIADTLDTSRERIFMGKEAVARVKEIKTEVEKEEQRPV